MIRLLMTATVALLVSFTLVAVPLMAALDMLEGTVMMTTTGKLMIQDQDGKNMHNLDVADDAKITRDGREARLENLMTGDWARVTTEKRLLVPTAVAIDARSTK